MHSLYPQLMSLERGLAVSTSVEEKWEICDFDFVGGWMAWVCDG